MKQKTTVLTRSHRSLLISTFIAFVLPCHAFGAEKTGPPEGSVRDYGLPNYLELQKYWISVIDRRLNTNQLPQREDLVGASEFIIHFDATLRNNRLSDVEGAKLCIAPSERTGNMLFVDSTDGKYTGDINIPGWNGYRAGLMDISGFILPEVRLATVPQPSTLTISYYFIRGDDDCDTTRRLGQGSFEIELKLEE